MTKIKEGKKYVDATDNDKNDRGRVEFEVLNVFREENSIICEVYFPKPKSLERFSLRSLENNPWLSEIK